MQPRHLLLILIFVFLPSAIGCNGGDGPVHPVDGDRMVACFTQIAPTDYLPGERVFFDASCSTPGLLAIEEYVWDWGDDSAPETLETDITTHSFPDTGAFDVKLTIRDQGGRTASVSEPIEIHPFGSAPTACFTYDAPDGWQPGSELIFDASCSADPDGDDLMYSWDWGDGYTSGPSAEPKAIHEFMSEGEVEVRLTVADSAGWSAVSDLVRISFGYPVGPPVVARLLVKGGAYDVAISGGYAYTVGRYEDCMNVIDIRDPLNPTLAGSLAMSAYTYGLDVSGELAVISEGGSRVTVVNVSDPSNPAVVGSMTVEGAIYDVAVSGRIAYVTEESFGLHILSLADPQAPEEIAAVEFARKRLRLNLDGNRLVVTSHRGYLILDVTNPASPVTIASLETGYPWFKASLMRGNHLYVTLSSGEVLILDISDPGNPEEVGRLGAFSREEMAATEGLLLLGEDGLEIVDISNPAFAEMKGSTSVGGAIGGLAISGDYLFAAASSAGLAVVDLRADLTGPRFVGTAAVPSAAGLDVVRDRMYVVTTDHRVVILDVADPLMPQTVGEFFTPGGVEKLLVSGTLMYIADSYQGLLVYDISDPGLPFLAAQTDLGGSDLAIADGCLYVAGGGLTIASMDDPENPVVVGTLEVGDRSHRLVIQGDYAYVCVSEVHSNHYTYEIPFIHVVDISDPTAPVSIASFTPPSYDEEYWPRELGMSGDNLAILCSRQGRPAILEVYDVSDPYSPVLAGSMEPGHELYYMRVLGRYAYIPNKTKGLVIVDLTDPTNPVAAGYAGAHGSISAVDLWGEHAYVMSGSVMSIIELW